jgi:hypothetical protein
MNDRRPTASAQQQPQSTQPPLFRPPTPESADDLASNVASLSVREPEPPNEQPVASTSASAAATAAEVEAAVSLPPDDRSLLLSEASELHLYDKATGMFMLQEKNVQSNLWLVARESFPCTLTSRLS